MGSLGLKRSAVELTPRMKTAWIIGAETPLGQAIAQRFYADGIKLLLSGRTEPPEGTEALCFPENPVNEALAEQALSQADRLDILVCAVRQVRPKPLSECTIVDFDEAIEENLAAAFCATRAAIRKIGRTQGGAILYVTSIHGEKPNGAAPMFSVACGCLNMLAREAALDCGRLGIRVNTLRAGAMEGDAPLFESPLSSIYDAMEEKVPLGRAGTPMEAAAAASFLCSPEASFINGAFLTCDGGFLGYYLDADVDRRWATGYGSGT